MGKHLVLVGGGHAHLTTLLKLGTFVKRGHRVTLISPAPFHYYSGMGPGLLGGSIGPREARFNIQRMAEERGGVFLQDQVLEVAASRRSLCLASGNRIDYDLVSFNIGSTLAWDAGLSSPRLVPVKPIENLYRARRDILARPAQNLRFVVVGGGPAGVEIAGNLRHLLDTHKGRGEILLVAGGGLLSKLPRRARDLARHSLEKRDIRILEQEPVVAVDDAEIHLESGRALPCDLAFAATGVRPPPVFRHSDVAVAEDGGLQVNAFLQSTSDPRIFGGGDCISLKGHSLPRVGVHAVRQNPVLLHNLRAALEDEELQEYRPQKNFLVILNMGDGTGIAVRGPFTGNGAGALYLKNWIDHRFMRRFQVSGEAEDATEIV